MPGGSLADRFGPRLVMLSSDVVRCAVTVVFTVLAASHVASLAAVAPLAAVLGACSALFLPASMTLMPSLINNAGLTSANALYTGFMQTGSMLGPLIGGVLVAMAGSAPAFAVDAGSDLISAACLALVGRPANAPQARQPGGAATAAESARPPEAVPAGIRMLLRRDRFLRVVLVVPVTANFAVTGITEMALPVLTHARYGAAGFGAGVLTRHLGPSAVLPCAGGLLALSYLYGLSHREFRELGKPKKAGVARLE